jgi:hypothetical protein
MREDALHRLPVAITEDIRPRVSPIADQLRKPSGDLPDRQDEIGESGRDRAARHRSVFGLVRILDENDASGLFDRLDADRAVRPGAGKDDREVVAALRCERPEEKIDRGAVPPRLVELGEREVLVGDQELAVGGNNIDAARLETDASGHLGHRHAGSSRKDIRQFALVLGVEVDDDNKRRIDVVRQSREKHLQRMNAPCRRSDADGREALGGLFSRCFLRVRGRLTVVVHWQPSYARGGPSPGRAASDLKHRFDWLNHL